jgi:Sec-independent protein secretion pathway component TatC
VAQESAVDDDKEAELEEGRMPLLDHLIELRNRLMWAIGAIMVAFLICYQFLPSFSKDRLVAT